MKTHIRSPFLHERNSSPIISPVREDQSSGSNVYEVSVSLTSPKGISFIELFYTVFNVHIPLTGLQRKMLLDLNLKRIVMFVNRWQDAQVIQVLAMIFLCRSKTVLRLIDYRPISFPSSTINTCFLISVFMSERKPVVLITESKRMIY